MNWKIHKNSHNIIKHIDSLSEVTVLVYKDKIK